MSLVLRSVFSSTVLIPELGCIFESVSLVISLLPL